MTNQYWGLISSEIKKLGREADRSPPSIAEVRNGGAVPPFPHISSWGDT
jgi:hypothetical protein